MFEHLGPKTEIDENLSVYEPHVLLTSHFELVFPLISIQSNTNGKKFRLKSGKHLKNFIFENLRPKMFILAVPYQKTSKKEPSSFESLLTISCLI